MASITATILFALIALLSVAGLLLDGNNAYLSFAANRKKPYNPSLSLPSIA